MATWRPTVRSDDRPRTQIIGMHTVPRHEHWDDTHRPARQGRGVHPPWSWKRQRPMEVGYSKVFLWLKVFV